MACPAKLKGKLYTIMCYYNTTQKVFTHSPKVYKPPQNYGRQNGDIKGIPYWGITNIRQPQAKFSGCGNLTPCIFNTVCVSRRTAIFYIQMCGQSSHLSIQHHDIIQPHFTGHQPLLRFLCSNLSTMLALRLARHLRWHHWMNTLPRHCKTSSHYFMHCFSFWLLINV